MSIQILTSYTNLTWTSFYMQNIVATFLRTTITLYIRLIIPRCAGQLLEDINGAYVLELQFSHLTSSSQTYLIEEKQRTLSRSKRLSELVSTATGGSSSIASILEKEE